MSFGSRKVAALINNLPPLWLEIKELKRAFYLVNMPHLTYLVPLHALSYGSVTRKVTRREACSGSASVSVG